MVVKRWCSGDGVGVKWGWPKPWFKRAVVHGDIDVDEWKIGKWRCVEGFLQINFSLC